jgi:hypothetical protein
MVSHAGRDPFSRHPPPSTMAQDTPSPAPPVPPNPTPTAAAASGSKSCWREAPAVMAEGRVRDGRAAGVHDLGWPSCRCRRRPGRRHRRAAGRGHDHGLPREGRRTGPAARVLRLQRRPGLGVDLAAPGCAGPEARGRARRRQRWAAPYAVADNPLSGSSTSTSSSSTRRTPAGRSPPARPRARRCCRWTATSMRWPRSCACGSRATSAGARRSTWPARATAPRAAPRWPTSWPPWAFGWPG